jgi:hypothetical protein
MMIPHVEEAILSLQGALRHFLSFEEQTLDSSVSLRASA